MPRASTTDRLSFALVAIQGLYFLISAMVLLGFGDDALPRAVLSLVAGGFFVSALFRRESLIDTSLAGTSVAAGMCFALVDVVTLDAQPEVEALVFDASMHAALVVAIVFVLSAARRSKLTIAR